MSITIEQAKALKFGDYVIDNLGKRWKVNGKVQTWKRNVNRIRVPVKHGLYAYGAIDETNLHLVSIEK